jgi:hypothetical protein
MPSIIRVVNSQTAAGVLVHNGARTFPIDSFEDTMAKTNFQYEKRQRELEKKRKTEEKARKKQDAKHGHAAESDEPGSDDAAEQREPSEAQAHDAA